MALYELNSEDADSNKKLRGMFGPQQVDHQVRQAIQFCWMSLPPEQQTIDEVEKQMRRILERALRDLREDAGAFGLGKPQ